MKIMPLGYSKDGKTHPCTLCRKRPNVPGYWRCARCMRSFPWFECFAVAVVGSLLVYAAICLIG